jgi:glycosyltransferase involved in cell wall biosynthesis
MKLGVEIDKTPLLEIFGDGHLRAALEHHASQLGIARSTRFRGNIPQSHVSEAIDRCHLFAFTSIAEGQCLAALEILSRGRPIVATPAGALGEILSDARLGSLVTPETPAAASASLQELIDRISSGTLTAQSIQSAYLERYSANEIGKLYSVALDELAAV